MELGVTLDRIEAMPHDQYIRWRAYMAWRQAQRDHQRDVADMRNRRALR